MRTKSRGGEEKVGAKSWSEELELESGVGERGGYSRVENVERVEQMRSRGEFAAALSERLAQGIRQ